MDIHKSTATLIIALLSSLISLAMPGGGGGGAGVSCPDNLNSSNNNPNVETVYVYDQIGDLTDSIECNLSGSGALNCDLSSYPSTYFFVYNLESMGVELDCFYDGGGVLITPIPLSVTFNDFSIFHTQNYNTLTWSTLDETNNDYYTIEYSLNGTDWVHLTDIKGNGTINTTSKYKHEHRMSGYNLIYYKLTQTDFDGTIHELSVKAVQSSVYEPIDLLFNDKTIYISSENKLNSITVSDLSGRILYDQHCYNTNSESVHLDSYHGAYIVEVIDAIGNQRNQKFVVH